MHRLVWRLLQNRELSWRKDLVESHGERHLPSTLSLHKNMHLAFLIAYSYLSRIFLNLELNKYVYI